eukprot:scaffold1000_cov66-Skeletonema_marinoi.AAC.1
MKCPPTLGEKKRAGENNEEEDGDGGGTAGIGRRKGRKKLRADHEHERTKNKKIVNPQPNPDFTVTFDDWPKLCNRAHLRPQWDDTCLMCPRWHSKAYCFPDCPNAASHVKSSEVSAKRNTVYKAFLQKAISD